VGGGGVGREGRSRRRVTRKLQTVGGGGEEENQVAGPGRKESGGLRGGESFDQSTVLRKNREAPEYIDRKIYKELS